MFGVQVMDRELNAYDGGLTDGALFWPTFLIFVALLLGIYVVTAPPGDNVTQALLTSFSPATGWGGIASTLLGR
jgi:hypothetical protein